MSIYLLGWLVRESEFSLQINIRKLVDKEPSFGVHIDLIIFWGEMTMNSKAPPRQWIRPVRFAPLVELGATGIDIERDSFHVEVSDGQITLVEFSKSDILQS